MFTFFGSKTYSKDDLDYPYYKISYGFKVEDRNKSIDDFHVDKPVKVIGIESVYNVEDHESLIVSIDEYQKLPEETLTFEY